MSKSLNNGINPFASEEILTKQINSIVTSSATIEQPKKPTDTLYKIYTAVIGGEDDFIKSYLQGGVGYGTVKKELLGRVLDRFSVARTAMETYSKDPQAIYNFLNDDEAFVEQVAANKINHVRSVFF